MIEKSPPNLIRGRFLQALFPGCAFIFILRHPAAVALATRKWTGGSITALVRHWVAAHELMAGDQTTLTRCRVVRYDDLNRDPATVVAETWTWLGLDPEPVVAPIEAGHDDRYARDWAARRRHWRWGWDVRAAEWLYGPRTRRFGFSVSSPPGGGLDRPPVAQ